MEGLPERQDVAPRRDQLRAQGGGGRVEATEAELWPELGMEFEDALSAAWPVAIRLARDPHLAEDLCGEVFAKLSKKFAAGSLTCEPGRGAAYIRRAVRNVFFDDYRFRTAESRGGGASPIVIGVNIREDQLPVVGQDPLDVVVGDAQSRAIAHAIDSLSPDHRRVMSCLVIGGFSIRDIGELLGRPSSTVRSRIGSARGEIRARLRRAGWEVDR